jgi:hypothetical protein
VNVGCFQLQVSALPIGSACGPRVSCASLLLHIHHQPSHTPDNPIISPITHITAAMFRTSIVRSARAVAQVSARSYSTPAFRRAIPTPFAAARTVAPVSRITAVRCYAAGSGLNQEEVTGRILDLLKNFDKVRILETKENEKCYTDNVPPGLRPFESTNPLPHAIET